MPIVLGLLAAVLYGASDFLGGLGSRRVEAFVVAGGATVCALALAILATLVQGGDGPAGGALGWGAVGGFGVGIGTAALYRGFAVGEISVVATLSGLLSAVIPVLVGLVEGNSLSALTAVGVVIAVPAIGLVSWGPRAAGSDRPSGAAYGIAAGLGFALLFVGLARAGTDSGAWPLVASEAAALAVTIPLAAVAWRRAGSPPLRPGVRLTLGAGLLAGFSNLAFLAATDEGELAVVAVLTALYPGFTVILARLVLGERWSSTQGIGLLGALVATVLVSAGA